MIIGTGIDIVEIARIRSIMEKLKDRFILRVFTAAEQEFCRAHRDPAPHFAARFAAKEALFKALGTGWAKGVTWLDVEVLRERQDAPAMTLYGEAKRLSEQMGARKAHVTLSHSDLWAVAMVILE
jgi:holo-[acyl-carrier protein] synthase